MKKIYLFHRRILVHIGFSSSEGVWTINPDQDHLKGTHPKLSQ